MDLLVALETIRNASDAILHCHAAQTILTLRSVSQRLQCRLSPDFHATPWNQPSPPSPPQSPHLLEVAETPALRGRPSVSSQSLLQVQAEVRDQITVLSSPTQSTQVSFSHVSAQSPSTPTTQLIPTRETSPSQSTQVSVSHVSAQSSSTPTTQLIPTRETPLGVIPPKPIRPQPDKITDLLSRIKKSAQWVLEISQLPFSQVLSCKRDIGEDLRLEHVRRLEGDTNLDYNAKLLRILAIRSMALEFTNDEVAAEVFPTKLEEIYRHALSQSPCKTRVFNYNTKDVSTKAKSAGLKHLVFEKVIAHRLKECGLPDMCDAVSTMCGLHIEKFRRFPYDQMLSFANMMLSQETQVMISDSKINLLDLIRYLSPWFQQLQVHYDCEICALHERVRHSTGRPTGLPYLHESRKISSMACSAMNWEVGGAK